MWTRQSPIPRSKYLGLYGLLAAAGEITKKGALAQLVERVLSMHEVRDSNSLGSTFFCADLMTRDPSRQNALLLRRFGHHPLLRGWLGNPARSVRCFCGALAHF